MTTAQYCPTNCNWGISWNKLFLSLSLSLSLSLCLQNSSVVVVWRTVKESGGGEPRVLLTSEVLFSPSEGLSSPSEGLFFSFWGSFLWVSYLESSAPHTRDTVNISDVRVLLGWAGDVAGVRRGHSVPGPLGVLQYFTASLFSHFIFKWHWG